MANSKIWVFGTIVISTFGCLKSIHPESSYLTQFYYGLNFNLTRHQVDREILPVSSYSNIVTVVFVILLTDVLRYKPVVVLMAVAIFLQKAFLLWGTSLLEMQASQFFIGVEKACIVAYKTYIYSITDKDNYQVGTALLRVATKFGFIFSSILAQVGKSFFNCTTEDLIKISFAVAILGLICALLLPFPKKKLYFNEEISSKEESRISGSNSSLSERTVRKLWKDLKEAYTDPYLLKYCIWWMVARGGHKLVTSFYVQSLWHEVSEGKENKYNAGVEAVITVGTIITCYVVGSIKVNWKVYGDITLATSTLLQGLAILGNASSKTLLISYPLYVMFLVLFDATMLITQSEIAKQLKSNRFAYIFGLQFFFSNSFNWLWTELIVTKHGLALGIRNQFRFISCIYLALGAGYAVKASIFIFRNSEDEKTNNEEKHLDDRGENNDAKNEDAHMLVEGGEDEKEKKTNGTNLKTILNSDTDKNENEKLLVCKNDIDCIVIR